MGCWEKTGQDWAGIGDLKLDDECMRVYSLVFPILHIFKVLHKTKNYSDKDKEASLSFPDGRSKRDRAHVCMRQSRRVFSGEYMWIRFLAQ